MSEMTDRMIQALHTELGAATHDIKQEIRHQGELSAQRMSAVEAKIQQIVSTVNSLEKRVVRLEHARGKAAISAWVWLMGTAGAVAITYLMTRLFGGTL